MRYKLLGCLLVLVLTGCSLHPATSTPYSTTTKDLTPTRYVMPGETKTPLIPTSTATIRVTRSSPTLTPTAIPTPTTPATPTHENTISPETIPVCTGRGVPLPNSKNFISNGTLLYQKRDYKGLYAIGGIPMTNSRMPIGDNENIHVFGISPDGRWLAYSPLTYTQQSYVVTDTLSVVLLSSTGEKTSHRLDIEQYKSEYDGDVFAGFSYGYWINNEVIYTGLLFQNPGEYASGRVYVRPKVLNPFDGLWQEELMSKLAKRSYGDAMGFSPDMSRTIYPIGGGITLRDLDKNIELWNDPNYPSPSPEFLVQWAPNNSMVAYGQQFDTMGLLGVHLISREGKGDKLIFDRNFRSFRVFFDWSPDSHYLAIGSDNGFSYDLFIYDVMAGQYLFRCPQNGDIWYRLIWSPDSSQVAYGIFEGSMRVLDIKTGEVVELVKDSIPVGWSDQFSVK